MVRKVTPLITDMIERKASRVFISYAWEDDAYKHWIERLAKTLVKDGFYVRYDRDCEPSVTSRVKCRI